MGLAPDRTVPKAKATPVPKAADGKKVPSRGRRRATEAFKGPVKKIIDPSLRFNMIWVTDSNPNYFLSVNSAPRNAEYNMFKYIFVGGMSSWPLARTISRTKLI